MIPDHYGKYEYEISFDKDQFTGKGESRSEAKEKAAIKTLLNTKYRFTEIPAELLPPVSSPIQKDGRSQDKLKKKLDMFDIDSTAKIQEGKSQDANGTAKSLLCPHIPESSNVSVSVFNQDSAITSMSTETRKLTQVTKSAVKKSTCHLKKENSKRGRGTAKSPDYLKDVEHLLTIEIEKQGESSKASGQPLGEKAIEKSQLTGPGGLFIPRSLRVDRKDAQNSKKSSIEVIVIVYLQKAKAPFILYNIYTRSQKKHTVESCISFLEECRQVNFVVHFYLPTLLVTMCKNPRSKIVDGSLVILISLSTCKVTEINPLRKVESYISFFENVA